MIAAVIVFEMAWVTAATLAIAAAGVGVGAASAAGAFDKKPKKPPEITDPSVLEAQTLQRQRAALAKGRGSTISTGPLGVDPGSPLLARPGATAGPGGGGDGVLARPRTSGPGGPGGL